MDKCFFMIVTDHETDSFDNFHKILQGLRHPQSNAVTYVIAPTPSKLRNYRQLFPEAICILLDVGRDKETSKEVLLKLPEMDCILDFTGMLASKILVSVEEPQLQFAWKETWEYNEATLAQLSSVLGNGDKEAVEAVLITIKRPEKDKEPTEGSSTRMTQFRCAITTQPMLNSNQQPNLPFKPSHKYSLNPRPIHPKKSASPSVQISAYSGLISGPGTIEERKPLMEGQKICLRTVRVQAITPSEPKSKTIISLCMTYFYFPCLLLDYVYHNRPMSLHAICEFCGDPQVQGAARKKFHDEIKAWLDQISHEFDARDPLGIEEKAQTALRTTLAISQKTLPEGVQDEGKLEENRQRQKEIDEMIYGEWMAKQFEVLTAAKNKNDQLKDKLNIER